MRDRYDMQGILGDGGFSRTHRAIDRTTGAQVCLKELLPELVRRNRHVERFRQEGRLGAEIDHPHVVRYLGEFYGPSTVDPRASTWWLVLEYLKGGDLERRVCDGGPPEVETAVAWAIQGLRGLAEMHRRGIIHRDVKPSNLLLDGGGRVKVADLGIARLALKSLGTRAGSVMGTVLWASPEQLLGDLERTNHPASDLYAAGATLYYLCTGRYPIALSENPTADEAVLIAQALKTAPPPASTWRAEISAELDAVIGRCMAKRQEERYPSAGDVIAELERVLGIESHEDTAGGPASDVLPIRIECIAGPHLGACFELWKPVLGVGRVRGDLLMSRDVHMSGLHGSFRMRAEGFGLEFVNGEPTVPTMLNGTRLPPRETAALGEGDHLKLGSSVFRVLRGNRVGSGSPAAEKAGSDSIESEGR